MKYKQISVGFYPADLEELEVISKELGKTKAACIRELLHSFLKLKELNQNESDHKTIQ